MIKSESIEFRIICIVVFRVHVVLRNTHSISETLVMRNFALTKKFNRIPYIRIIHKAQNVIISNTSFLFCCNFLRTTFSEIPMNFNGNVPCSRNTAANRYIINQRFHDFAGQVFQVSILFDQFTAIVARRDFFVEFG